MKFVVAAFSGMAPRFADHLLQDAQASYAANLKATAGDMRGFNSLLPIETLTPAGVYRRVARLYYEGSDDFVWFKSEDANADVALSPLAADAFQRYYFTEAGRAPQINTLDRLGDGLGSINLGLPVPDVAPGVAATGGSGVSDTRAYTYVYISAYGEQSSPAPPQVGTAFLNSTWTVTVPIVGGIGFNVVAVDIYRSSTGNASSGQYYKVARTLVGGDVVDTMAADLVPLQLELDSFDYGPPPNNMQGLVTHSSGALVGFAGRTVYFSQPYLPHAWPEAYRFNLDFEVVGLAAVSNMICVMTKGSPTVLTGDSPGAMTPTYLKDYEPCVSKRSIVTTQGRAIYASPNGLISLSPNGIENITNDILTAEDWAQFDPADTVAALYGRYYIAFTSPSQGYVVVMPQFIYRGPQHILETTSISFLDRYDRVTGVDTDPRDGNLYVIQNDEVSLFDQVDDRTAAVTFRTKEFIAPKPVNMGALQVLFPAEEESPAVVALRNAARVFNLARFAEGPLDGLGMYPVGGSIETEIEPTAPTLLPVPGNALGGAPLYELEAFSTVPQVRATIIADRAVRYSRVITDEGVVKLPSGYKATRWYVELSGAARVQRLVLAETARECRTA